MKKIALIVLALLLMSSIAFGLPIGVNCPEDNTVASFTGESRVAMGGGILYLFKCPYGHTFWIRD